MPNLNIIEKPAPISARLFLPPVDPYVASAGFNMLVQVTFARIARYLSDTWIAQESIGVNAKQLIAAVQAAKSTTFTSPFLKSVNSGSTNNLQIGVTCDLSVFAVSPGSTGEVTIRVRAMFSGFSFTVQGIKPYEQIKTTPLGEFGPLVLQFDAPLSVDLDAAHAIATITAKIAGAAFAIDQSESSSEAEWLALTDAGKAIVSDIQQTVASAGTVSLTPPISPFGDLSGSNVFETFLADAFPTQNPSFAAAGLSVGFRLRNAAVATPADVQSIAGFDDYGTILDEWTMARVLESRWPQGYLKSFDYTGTIKADLGDGKGAQDVQMWGSLTLKSLDDVTIEPGQSANADDDYLDLSGACTVTIDKVKTLSDGHEQVLQKDNSFDSNWSFAAGVSPNPTAATKQAPASEQAFIDTASKKTVKYLARPFRGVAQTVSTGSLDGAAGFIYSTGRF